MPKPKKQNQPDGDLPHLALERFVPEKVRRSQINLAEYNPRILGAESRRKLDTAIDKHGLVELLVWNRRTGVLVGGHQRLKKLDKSMGFPGRCPDYTITVAAIDVDDKAEREINILLNNDGAQGEFDLEKLEALFHSGLDPAGMGWDDADVFRLFGDTKPPESADEARANVEKAVEAMLSIERGLAEAREAASAKDNSDFYMVVVFPSYEARKKWTDSRGLADNRYQPAEILAAPVVEAEPAPPTTKAARRRHAVE